jgi:hypothetical protein
VLTLSTATPIANSLSEMWLMQHYARPDRLEVAGGSRTDPIVPRSPTVWPHASLATREMRIQGIRIRERGSPRQHALPVAFLVETMV